MRVYNILALTGLLALAGCGGSTPPITISVNCNGNLALVGAQSVDVVANAGKTTLKFPDPANAGQTGSIDVPPGQDCTLTPQQNTK